MVQKIPSIYKKVSNKNDLELNFLQKIQQVQISIFLMTGAKGFQRLTCLKYFNELEWESRFTLRLNTTKNVDYIKKYASNKNCSELNFLQKTQWVHMSISSGSIYS